MPPSAAAKEDPLLRDGKRLPLSGGGIRVWRRFALDLLIGVPLWICVLLPLALISMLVSRVMAMFRQPVEQWKAPALSAEAAAPAHEPTPESIKARRYDLVLFGATGFTGQLAAKYLAQCEAAKGIRWAIAGRRIKALEALRAELVEVNPTLQVSIIVADSSQADTLKRLVENTKCVITTAGPFAKYGTPLVQLCATHGTHYCDITGESDWVREMIGQYDDVARSTGAHIVHFCGHDCIPWDLAVLAVARALREEKQEDLTHVHCYDEISASASGGTVATALMILEGGRARPATGLGYDPLLKAGDERSTFNTASANQGRLGYVSASSDVAQSLARTLEARGGAGGAWVGPFVMASVMANCIKRSNAVNKYAPRLVYKEAQVYPSFMAGFISLFEMLALGTALFCPPLRSMLKRWALPKPGEGPSKKSQERGFLRVNVDGVGHKGSHATAAFYFPVDPGYRDTARMLVESGLTLVLQQRELKCGGGVWTPACCQGMVLLQRLVASGSDMKLELK